MESPKYYRDKAEELRVISALLCTQECRDIVLKVADSYDDMAKQSQKRKTDRDMQLESPTQAK